MSSTKGTIFIFAYWHDPRFKRKAGGLLRIFELANNLTKMGYTVRLFLPKLGYPQKQTTARVIEIPFIDLPIIRPLSFHLASTFLSLVRLTEGPQIFYVRKMNSFIPLLVARLAKIPSVFEVPNDPYLAYKSAGRLRSLIEKKIDEYCLSLADRVVVLSHWSRRRLHELGKIPLAHMLVAPSGTDTELFRPMAKDKCCRNLGIDPAFTYVGFVGSFFAPQGVDTLIQAAQIIVSKYKNIRFLLVGDGPMMKTWKAETICQGLQDEFIFFGQVAYRRVPKYLGAMDICVAPHRWDSNQASPVKLFDYMACGRPIVASDIEVVREITENSGCALLVPPGNPGELAQGLALLIENEQRRRDMGKKGRAHVVAHFDRERITTRLIQTVAKLCSDHPGQLAF